MEIELLKSIALGIPIMFFAMVVYINLLLGIACIFGGVFKFILSMLLYIAFSIAVVLPLVYLVNQTSADEQESTYNLIAALCGYALIMAPSFYYLGKVKIKELQRAGYFLPRS